MKGWVWGAVVVMAGTATLEAQDSVAPRASMTLVDRSDFEASPAPSLPPGTAAGPTFSLGAEGRMSFPVSGEVVHTQLAFVWFIPVEIQGTSYKDLFPRGAGGRLEAALAWDSPGVKYSDLIWQSGVYLRAGCDRFGGDSTSDDFGNSFSPQSLTVTTAVVGVRGGTRSRGGLFGEGRVGLGVVHYSAVSARFSVGGAPETSGELLAATTGVASELGLKVGYRSEQVEVSLGIDTEFQQGPERGRDASKVVDPDAVVFFGVTLGLAVRF